MRYLAALIFSFIPDPAAFPTVATTLRDPELIGAAAVSQGVLGGHSSGCGCRGLPAHANVEPIHRADVWAPQVIVPGDSGASRGGSSFEEVEHGSGSDEGRRDRREGVLLDARPRSVGKGRVDEVAFLTSLGK